MKLYFESKGHEFTHRNKLISKELQDYDVLISGWADEGVKWLSRHEKVCRKYACWVRSYEYWHNNAEKIDYSKFDKVYFVNKWIMDNMGLPQGKMMPNAINLDEFKFKEKNPGKDVLLLADVNFKKGIPLLMQLAKKMPDYRFHIFGNVTDKRLFGYIRYSKPSNVYVRGYASDVQYVFDSMNYILLTSPVEGNPNCIIEGMASGLKPVVHRFVGSNEQFPFYWDTIDEAEALIREDKYESLNYRKWIEDKYDMWKIYPELEKDLL